MNPLTATQNGVSSVRLIAHRTHGNRHGPVTRLMSPSDLGQVLKPFVFLDLFDHDGSSFDGPLHPHSGIATLTYMLEGEITYIDPDSSTGTLGAGGVEWMQAGRGMWHGGGFGAAARSRGFQLWIALPPELELGKTVSRYQAPEDVVSDGPVRVLLGTYGTLTSGIVAPSPITYLAVRLARGERWQYVPPAGHSVLWVAIASGKVRAPEELLPGELVAFAASERAVDFVAVTDVEFVLGSAVPHQHSLVLGH